jgi:hypothetical protein
MKKLLQILTLLLLLGVVVVYLFLRPRSIKRMEETALFELEEILGKGYKAYNLKGPLIDTTHNEYVSFQWYKILNWGDTASIYIDVFKRLSSFSWRDNYFWPRVTMNHQWSYLAGSRSEFKDVLPIKTKNKTLILSSLQLYPNQEKYYENSEVLIRPERLFFYLKNGYFEVLEKRKEYTVATFYEPIGYIYQGNDTILTMAAKVYLNDAAQVLILPYNAPVELWNKKQE